jgi:hypothetical protein
MCSDRQPPHSFLLIIAGYFVRASRNFCSRAAKCPLQNRGFSSIFVSLWPLGAVPLDGVSTAAIKGAADQLG